MIHITGAVKRTQTYKNNN